MKSLEIEIRKIPSIDKVDSIQAKYLNKRLQLRMVIAVNQKRFNIIVSINLNF